MRDPYKLKAFALADALALKVYGATRSFPVEERYGLQSQLRRGAVSVATNLVEGSAKPSARDYLRFVAIAIGSASEVKYLVSLATPLSYISRASADELIDGYDHVARALQSLTTTLQEREDSSVD